MEKETWVEHFTELAKAYANACYLVSEESHPEQEEYDALEDLKFAMRQTFASQKEKILGVLEGMEMPINFPQSPAVELGTKGYNQALSDIKKKISEM